MPALPPRGDAAPRGALEALERARDHARLAAAEGLAALRALLDAASLAATGAASDELRLLGSFGRQLDEAEAALRGGSMGGDALVAALADALEAEIGRWQARSAEDPEARAVLRAFLGLRELLWELGVRTRSGEEAVRGPRAAGPTGGPRGAGASRPRAAGRGAAERGAEEPRKGPRVQRIPVEG
jgi:hypothetical protein